MPIAAVTISGIDSGGFAWQNVLHVEFTLSDGAMIFEDLDAINQLFVTNVVPAYTASMNHKSKVLDVSSQMIFPSTSYSLHHPINADGARVLDPAIGQICGVVSLLPISGTKIGRVFAVGAAIADFVLDVIDPTYQGLLDDLGDALAAVDGSVAPQNPQLVIYNKSTNVGVPVVHTQTKLYPTTLNKRLRA